MIRYDLMGVEDLAIALKRKSILDFKRVEKKNVLQMRNRAVGSQNPSKGGTPVDTSELRLSASVSPDGSTFGYTKDYGPHVEFGHRTAWGGYVPGQYYLKANVNIQRPIFKNDLVKEMRKK